MKRYFLFLSLLAFTGCFNENEPEILGCGVVDTEPIATCGNNDNPEQAPEIFKAKCASCHRLQKDGTGPKLTGILDRVPSEEWLRSFISNQDSLIAIGDEYTLEIMEFSPVKWSHHLSNAEQRDFDTLISYITQ